MKERIIYECEFCRSVNHPKRLLRKDQMVQHEHNCFYNPKNRTCLTCANNQNLYMRGAGRNGIGCYGGAVKQEQAHEEPMTAIFRNFNCPKYHADDDLGEEI
jgi:hypothetical protein